MDTEIKINDKSCNNVLIYLPKAKSNFELISNLNNDIKNILYNGCGYYPHLLTELSNLELYDKLKEDFSDIDIINWSKHYKIDNPNKSIIFNKIIDCLAKYFNVQVLATRINYYTENDYKPFHHDSHAYTDGLKEDITIGLSLGDPRTLIFKHVETDNIFYFPQNNGDVFTFDYLTNIKFQHGIKKISPTKKSNRFSIIIWGKKL
jgi:hypothetical protein